MYTDTDGNTALVAKSEGWSSFFPLLFFSSSAFFTELSEIMNNAKDWL